MLSIRVPCSALINVTQEEFERQYVFVMTHVTADGLTEPVSVPDFYYVEMELHPQLQAWVDESSCNLRYAGECSDRPPHLPVLCGSNTRPPHKPGAGRLAASVPQCQGLHGRQPINMVVCVLREGGGGAVGSALATSKP